MTFSFRVFDKSGDPYLTRIPLTPQTRWGQLKLHWFHRGDVDPDPHDHPWDFYTFPLTDYVEQVMDDEGLLTLNAVERFTWHRRPAEYVHRVEGRALRRWWMTNLQVCDGPVITLMWNGPKRRSWGFWVKVDNIAASWFTDNAQSALLGSVKRSGRRLWVHWRTYVDHG